MTARDEDAAANQLERALWKLKERKQFGYEGEDLSAERGRVLLAMARLTAVMAQLEEIPT